MGKVDVVLWKWRGRLPKEFLEELNEALAWDETKIWTHGFSTGVDSTLGWPQTYLRERLYELLNSLTCPVTHVIKMLEDALDDIKYIQTCLKSEVSQYVYNILKDVHVRIDEAIDELKKGARL